MLNDWLRWAQRAGHAYTKFDVVDCPERAIPTDVVKTFLAERLTAAQFDPDFLRAAAEELGWGDVHQHVVRMQPRGGNMRRGRFGEVLAVTMLELWHRYEIVVPKLRFAITSDQSLPGTDAIVLRRNAAGTIVEVLFVESKLRTTRSAATPLEGYEQLQGDYNTRVADMLMYVAARLYETNNPSYAPFMQYMRSRARAQVDRFRLVLVWDVAHWDDESLDRIEEHEPILEGTTLDIVLATSLRQLIDDVYQRINVRADADDA